MKAILPFYTINRLELPSVILNRIVIIEIISPPEAELNSQECSVLFLNDGQEIKSLGLKSILEELYIQEGLKNLISIALFAGERIEEYGVAGVLDFKGRGARAEPYHQFLIQEIFPLVKSYFGIKFYPEITAFVGFSLGGLAAFDFAWEHPEYISKVGVFSGSFWWRSKDLGSEYTEADRIMHSRILSSNHKPKLKFWLQTGTNDEKADRNQNGIIDSIDDTLDIVSSLEKKGYEYGKDIIYFEVEGGEHNFTTWSQVMPEFLKWAFLN